MTAIVQGTEAAASESLSINAGTLRDSASVTLADAFLKREMVDNNGVCILQFWRGDFYIWQGAAYAKQEPEVFQSQVLKFLRSLRVLIKGKSRLYQPEPRNVRNVIDTLKGECQAGVAQMPAWMDERRPDPRDIIPFRNGLLNVKTILEDSYAPLIPPTPNWFSELVLPYDWTRGALCPHWQNFLASVLPEGCPVALLQEWFGYCLTADTRHQKLMLMIGPPRCGKGTIIRALQRLVGKGNYVSPPFYSLNEPFGLEPMLGKRVATIPDAHLGRDADAGQVLDRLLQVSGEDEVTVNRKNKPAIASARLGVRFTIAANEPPDLPDASGAIIPRLLMLQFKESFAGREDLQLDDKISTETPGIAIWAIEGLKRLRRMGRFSEPTDSTSLRNDYLRQAAPIHAFLQDRCELGPDPDQFFIEVNELWAKWKEWATFNNHQLGTKEALGKRLRTATAGKVVRARPMKHGVQAYEYHGIRIRPDGSLPW